MRSILKINAIENFKGQKASGSYSFDLKEYAILSMCPYEFFGLDAEMKKTMNALYLQVKEIDSGRKEIFFCSEIKIENV